MKNSTSGNISFTFSILLLLLFAACSKNDKKTNAKDFIVMSASGDITATLNDFRQLLGDQLNTSPGAVAGHREINWDGVPEEWLNLKLPEDFFNPTGPIAPVGNQCGLIYSSDGNFQVSKTNFAEVNASASGGFSSFSGDGSFANISTSLWDVEFQVPGQAIPAKIQGFGIVFSDVDQPESTSLEFFNGTKSLGKFFVPAKDGSNFSFLGVYFKDDPVTRVRVTHDSHLDKGENDISDNGPADLVIMDNFLYNEPVKF